jgi:RimJ/RimL family protein N-acetyltransferase
VVSRQILKKEHIITDRLTLGPYRKEDRERLKEMMQNPKITATFMVPDYCEEVQFYALADKLIEFSQINDTIHLEYGIYLDGYMIVVMMMKLLNWDMSLTQLFKDEDLQRKQ